jgi:ABC-type lipoprotein export system ATPase subunit
VTHSTENAAFSNRVIRLHDGKVVSGEARQANG